MPDNVGVPGGSAGPVATDFNTSSSEHYQIIKVGYGARDANALTVVDPTHQFPVQNTPIGATAPADALAPSSSSAPVLSFPELWNGATTDRARANITGALIAAGATTTQSAIALTTYNAAKLVLVANITAGAGSIVVAISGSTSSSYAYSILTSASLSGNGVTALRVFPGATPSANAVANDVVPRNVLVTVTVTGTITYGVDYVLVV